MTAIFPETTHVNIPLLKETRKIIFKSGFQILQPSLDELIPSKELRIFYELTVVVVPINYVSEIKMFIHVMLLQYIRILCLSTRVTICPLEVFRREVS